MITFTNIKWRDSNDANIFDLDALRSIELDGLSQGIITINCICGKFKAPYYKLRFGGGIDHFTFITKHPNEIGKYLEIAIFDDVVAVVPANDVQDGWFEYKCRTYIPSFKQIQL